MSSEPARVSAVVLAYRAEPWLRSCVAALLSSEKVSVDVVLVDNGCTTDDVEVLESTTGVTVVRPGTNLGFAGGCNVGAAAARGDYIALVNGDAIVEPETLSQLVAQAVQPDVAVAGASIRLADDPRLINAGDNPVHVLGLCWAGRLGQPEDRTEPADITVASGACLLLRTELWRRMGGFDAEYFAYHEDTELSIRAGRMGLRVVYVPDAVAVHRYEFSRNQLKYYLIERNRLMFLATLWSWRALLLLSPALLALEVGMLALAARQGWLRGKLRSYRWLAGHAGHIWRRRRQLAAERSVPNRVWMARLTDRLDTTAIDLPAVTGVLNIVMRAYWRLIRAVV
ncbi:MAG: glycosyltransferase family 2 protein [Dactylosporangium sp.]|nr:glycosyltransferase family 2 protein [Dactylosporangium sp.]NNJ62843.1 glycosyltransferase family 2 protein [Dactylosporangium sp.]